MKRAKKIWLIAAISLMAVGLIVFSGSLAALDFDFSKLSTKKYETNTYEVNGDFDKISIDVTTTEIEFLPSDNEKCRIECFEEEKLKHSAVVKNGTLIIDTVYTGKWYDNIGVSFENAKMTVYLSENDYVSLSVNTDTGDVIIPKDFTFKNFKVYGSTANIVCHASASDTIEIRTDTGDIKADTFSAEDMNLSTATGNITINSAAVKGIIDVETDTGKIQLTDVNCEKFAAESDTGNISLKNVTAANLFSIENDTGNVKFESSDAASIFVKTNTGNVTGTLLSEKIFITETSTGNVSVPKTITGGKCEIMTDTGDIKIDIQ